METKAEFVERRYIEAMKEMGKTPILTPRHERFSLEDDFELEINSLASELAKTDNFKRFMSRRDTKDCIDYIDYFIDNNVLSHLYSESFIHSLLKHNAKHHGIHYKLPAHIGDKEFRKMQNRSKNLFEKLPLSVKITGGLMAAFLIGRATNSDAAEIPQPPITPPTAHVLTIDR